MICQTKQKTELNKLVKRREELRDNLRDHFSLPVVQRNYKSFEKIVDELEELRKRIRFIQEQEKR